MPREHYQHLLLDWDGTLQFSLAVWLAATLRQLHERNIHLTESVIASHIVPNLSHAEKYGVQDLRIFVDSVVAESLIQLPSTPLNEELWGLLITLKEKNIKQAIVTNSFEKAILDALIHHKKDRAHFDHIVARERVKKNKPDAEPLILALSLMQAEPQTAVMIGDSPTDILAGRNAGMHTIWYYPAQNEVFYNYVDVVREFQPTYVARTNQELQDIILQTMPVTVK